MVGLIDRDLTGDFGGNHERRVWLSTALATAHEKRIALAIAAVSFIAFLGIVPFARTGLTALPAFIPAYEAALFFIDLITAVLLFDQFARAQTRGMLFLASAYLFDALIIVPHALSFPGAFWPTGMPGAGVQTTAWLYVFWHGGFSVFVIGYALWSRRNETAAKAPWTHRQIAGSITGSIICVALLTVVLTLIATWGHDLLPVVMQGGDYSLLVKKGISPAVWILTCIGMLLLLRREQRVMDLWLMLVMWIWLFDIALSAVVGSNRFDLGFYSGRIFGLLAASFLLLALIIETIRLYSSAERRLAQLTSILARGEIAPSKSSDEPAELFVIRENIMRYRALLKSTSLSDVQRHTIEELLDAEERRYRG